MDGSFHSPEWHAARLASLNTSHTITWEEYKKKQKVSFSWVKFSNYYFMFLCLDLVVLTSFTLANALPNW